MVRLISLLLLACLLCLSPVLAADEAPKSATATTPTEEKLGKETAEQIEKQYKLVNDEATIKKLNLLVAEIAPVTQRPDVVYTCKILDVGALNAMVIPGGTIYVTKGLLQAVESDHELVAVLAHEVAHNSLYHAKTMMEREAKISFLQLLSTIIMVYSSRDSEVSPGQIITMSQMVKEALMNGYGVDLEIQADLNGVEYLHKLNNKYDPVGLYSVILGFRQMEMRHPPVELGYLKTHPFPDDRRVALEKKFKELGITINLWRVVNFKATATPPAEGEQGYGLKLGNTPLLTVVGTDGTQDAKARAETAASDINRRFMKYPVQAYDVDLDAFDGKAYVRIRQLPVITITQADADAAGLTLKALGERVVQNIKTAMLYEAIKRA